MHRSVVHVLEEFTNANAPDEGEGFEPENSSSNRARNSR
jgi:hypothetical protein